jgi:hypothetical protein
MFWRELRGSGLACFPLAVLFLSALAGPSRADMIQYHVTVDSSSIGGTNGSLEFQFNKGGPNSLDATATISNFSGGTLVGAPIFDPPGAGSGTLSPGPLLLNNDGPLNSAFHDFIFPSSGFSFDVAFTGPAVDTPDPSQPGSRFSLTLWDQNSATVLAGDPANPLLSAPGFDATLVIDITPTGGSTTFSAPETIATAVPEPSSIVLASIGLAALAFGAWRRRVAKNPQGRHSSETQERQA